MPRRSHDAGSMPRVGAVLRKLRETAGLTVAEVAAICGAHRKTWYRREHLGIIPPPTELDAFARSVDRQCPLRAKAKILRAAGMFTDREADAMVGAGLLLMERLSRQRPDRNDGSAEEAG